MFVLSEATPSFVSGQGNVTLTLNELSSYVVPQNVCVCELHNESDKFACSS